MRKLDMNIQPIDSSTFMTIVTTGLYVVSVIFGRINLDIVLGHITLQGVAAIAAILAGISTFIFNIYRFYKEYKNNKQT